MMEQQQVPRNRGDGATTSRFQSFFCGGCRSQAVVVDQVVFGRAPAHTAPLVKKTKHGKQQQKRMKIAKGRTNTSTTRTPSGGGSDNDDHDGRDKSPYDTVSNSEDDETRSNTRNNRTNTKKQEATTVPPPRQRRSFLVPTREIIPIHDSEMAEVSFLTIDPLLITVSTDPPTPPKPYSYPDFGASPTTNFSTSSSTSRTGNDGGSHRRPANDNDSTYYEDRYDNDNISDITGFREYSLISM